MLEMCLSHKTQHKLTVFKQLAREERLFETVACSVTYVYIHVSHELLT